MLSNISLFVACGLLYFYCTFCICQFLDEGCVRADPYWCESYVEQYMIWQVDFDHVLLQVSCFPSKRVHSAMAIVHLANNCLVVSQERIGLKGSIRLYICCRVSTSRFGINYGLFPMCLEMSDFIFETLISHIHLCWINEGSDVSFFHTAFSNSPLRYSLSNIFGH